MSEELKSYKELILYALAKVIDARCSVIFAGYSESFDKMFGKYYSSLIALINVASPYLSNLDGLLKKAARAWEVYGSDVPPELGRATKILDEVFREVINEVKEVIE